MANAARYLPRFECANCRMKYYAPYKHPDYGNACPGCLLPIQEHQAVGTVRKKSAKKKKAKAPRERGDSVATTGCVTPKVRLLIYKRDQFTCVACGVPGGDLTIDHIIPRSKGGTNDPENLQTMCSACNHAKGDTLPKDASVDASS